MNLHRALWLSLPIALVLGGCAHGVGSSEATESVGEAIEQPAKSPAGMRGRGHGRMGHRMGGPAGVLLHAARDLELKPAQVAAVEKLEAQLREAGPVGPDRGAAHQAMVAGVREGKIDRAKIEAAASKGREAHKAAQIAALDGLHAALTPAQRQELAASVRARHEGRGERGERGMGRGRHHGEHGGMRAEMLVKKLDLDAAQQRAVDAIVQKREAAPAPEGRGAEMKARMDTLLAAFAADGFSAAKQDMGPPAGTKMDPALSHADFLAELLPVLRADQREKLALSMEKRHERRGHRGEAPAE